MKVHLKFSGWLLHVLFLMKNKTFLLVIFFSGTFFPQQELEKWGKSEDPYLFKKSVENKEYQFSGDVYEKFVLNNSILLYRLFISDQDGERCPFTPSCSNFFLESINKTSFVQGILMFSDRFTRDLNFFNRKNYPFIKNGRHYDPPYLYTLKNPRYPPQE